MISFIFSVLQFVFAVLIGADLLKSLYSTQKGNLPSKGRNYLWFLLTLAVVLLIGSLIQMWRAIR
jgi:hypothetical protein